MAGMAAEAGMAGTSAWAREFAFCELCAGGCEVRGCGVRGCEVRGCGVRGCEGAGVRGGVVARWGRGRMWKECAFL
jgi:hypothetical protein